MLTVLFLLLQAQVPLQNAAFDDPGEGIPGWALREGAQSGPSSRKSTAVVDRSAGRDGKGALVLRGDAQTDEWLVATQDFAVAGGEELELRFWARGEGIQQEGRQFQNANAILSFFDQAGSRLALEGSARLEGTRPWSEVTFQCEVPSQAKKASLGFFLSMTGALWIDDVRVELTRHAPWSPALAPAAWQQLVDRMCATYPFPDEAAGVAAFRERADKLKKRVPLATNRTHFIVLLQDLLDPLQDLHVWLEVDGKTVPTGEVKQVRRNSNVMAVQQELEEVPLFDGTDIAGCTKDGIGYLRIGSLGRGEGPIRRLLATKAQLKKARAWILDLRDNGGGAEVLGRMIAEQFSDQARVYARRRTRSGDGFGPWQDVSFGPARGKPDLRPLVVLQGPHTVSSAEGLLKMLRTLPQCTTVGLPSRGASGNPAPVRLAGDLRVFASTWQDALPDGTLTEDKGIAPKVTVDLPDNAYKLADPAFLKALEILRK